MNKIRVLIEYLPSGQGTINYGDTAAGLTALGNDISNPAALNTAHIGGIRPFILGISKLGENEQGGDSLHFWGKQEQWDGERQVGGEYSGFWSLKWCDANGVINPAMSFAIVGADIDHFVIRFDETLREWATLISVDGVDYANNDALFAWSGTKLPRHMVQIKKWNVPNRQVKITSILIGLTIEYDRSKIKNLVAGSQSTFDNTKPSSGVVPQYGSIKLIDTDGNLLELAQMELLKAGLSVKIYLDTSEGQTEMLGSYSTGKFNYSYGDTTASVELQDNVLEWSDVFFGGISSHEDNSAYTFFLGLKNQTFEQTQNTVAISGETDSYLNNITMPDGFLAPSNLTAAWDTFCAATGTRIRKNIKDEIWLTM